MSERTLGGRVERVCQVGVVAQVVRVICGGSDICACYFSIV